MHCKSCHCNSCPLLVPAFGSCFNPPDSDGLQDATKKIHLMCPHLTLSCLFMKLCANERLHQINWTYRIHVSFRFWSFGQQFDVCASFRNRNSLTSFRNRLFEWSWQAFLKFLIPVACTGIWSCLEAPAAGNDRNPGQVCLGETRVGHGSGQHLGLC